MEQWKKIKNKLHKIMCAELIKKKTMNTRIITKTLTTKK